MNGCIDGFVLEWRTEKLNLYPLSPPAAEERVFAKSDLASRGRVFDFD